MTDIEYIHSFEMRGYLSKRPSHISCYSRNLLFSQDFPLPPAGSSKLNVIPDSSLSLYPACPTDVLVVQRCLLESGPPLSTAPLRAPHLASLARI